MPTTMSAWNPDGQSHSAAPGEDPIRTEIAGTVLRLEVAVGDEVAEGDAVALLESMKMEIPVIAETAGTIARVTVAENSTVQVDDVIATVVTPSRVAVPSPPPVGPGRSAPALPA